MNTEVVAGGPPWTQIAIAVLGLLGVIFTAVWARRGERRGNDWQRIEGLWDRLDKQDERIATLEGRVTALQTQNTGQAQQISRLERWRNAALEYIALLLATLKRHGIEAPEAPPDYTDHH